MNTLRGLLILAACALSQACVTANQELPEPASDEDAARANLNLGAAYVRQGDYELALEKLERAVDQNPRLAEAHSTLAIVYDQLGETDNAERHYERATRLQPSNADVQNNHAVFLCRQGRWEEAEPHFRRAVNNTRNMGPEVALTNAGQCALDADNRAAAEEYFRSALERDPQFVDALLGMLEVEYDRGNNLQARAFMQRAFEVRDPEARQLLLCVNIERELGNSERAADCEQELREDFPQSAELARLRERERERDAAQ